MRLRQWDWDREGYVEEDYPDAPIVEFVNWLRTTKAWHQDPELVHSKVRKLNLTLAAHRQAKVEAAVATAKNMKNADVEARAERNRGNLAKARAALAKKVAARKVAKVLSPDGELPRDL